ncbi:MAG: OmpA family protein [Saprospiraceae bacterium]
MNSYKSLFLFFFTCTFIVAACTYTQKIRDGRTAFERKQYKVAIPFLKKEYNRAKTRIEKGQIAYLLGESFANTYQHTESIDWYQIAYDNNYGTDALKNLAYAYKHNEQYEDAMDAFKNLGIEIGSPYEYRREIEASKKALEWQKKKSKIYSVEELGINSSAADYAPRLYKDGRLVFTSDRGSATGEEKYNWTGAKFSDLFIADPDSKSVEQFNNQLNTPFNEGTATFNADFTEMFFVRCFGDAKEGDFYCKLMRSEAQGNGWSKPEVLDFVRDEVNYKHPTLSEDGSILYFATDDPDGWGGYDIFFVERTPDGWTPPKVMSRSINTPGDEVFPTIDGDTLYFSSNHLPGMGGLDIFKTYKLNSDTWSRAKNLRAPLNSSGDDFGYIIDKKKQPKKGIVDTGYFTSSRADGSGKDDIYAYVRNVPPPPPPPDPEEEEKPIVYQLLLKGYVVEKIFEDPTNPETKVLGRKPLSNSRVQISFGGEDQTITTGDDGLFEIEMNESTDYNFFASKDGYLSNQTRFSTRGIGQDPDNPIQTFEVEVELDKIFQDREIVLDNIYYDFDKWDIREDAQPTLNDLVRDLQLNPNIKIQMSSHTDCQGNPRYNEDLSQKRAQSAVDYLIANGVSPERLVAKGYGESQLRIDCVCARCTEDEHQANRRTTFKIIEAN